MCDEKCQCSGNLNLTKEEAASTLFWLDKYCTSYGECLGEECPIEKYCPKDGTKHIDDAMDKLEAFVQSSDASDAEEDTLP